LFYYYNIMKRNFSCVLNEHSVQLSLMVLISLVAVSDKHISQLLKFPTIQLCEAENGLN
jgi:hypothetical protein